MFEALEGLPILQTLRARAHEGEALKRVTEICAHWQESSSAVKHSGALDLLKGGLFYAVDALDLAHAIFQDDPSPEGSYWHGMLHRREGDFWNAKYWFQRAGRISAIKDVPGFDPVAFVTRCERAAQHEGAEEPAELLELQRREWEALLKAAYEKAFRK